LIDYIRAVQDRNKCGPMVSRAKDDAVGGVAADGTTMLTQRKTTDTR
jgi:hypothetical protein